MSNRDLRNLREELVEAIRAMMEAEQDGETAHAMLGCITSLQIGGRLFGVPIPTSIPDEKPLDTSANEKLVDMLIKYIQHYQPSNLFHTLTGHMGPWTKEMILESAQNDINRASLGEKGGK